MTERRDPDVILAAWLEEGPDVLPESTRRAIEVTTRTTDQARHLAWLPWRAANMNGTTRLALVAAAVVAVAVGGLSVLRPGTAGPGVGGAGSPLPSSSPSSASPTASPSDDPLDTAKWTTYVSSRYGFSIDHPADWTEDPADHAWTFEKDFVAHQSTGVESFTNAEGSVRTSAWSVAVTPDTTVEGWMEAYCAAQEEGPCTGIQEGAVDVKAGDQHPGRLLFGPDKDTMAFFLDGQTMYVVAIWRGETDPTVQPYGGARKLLEAFCSTLTLPTKPPQGSPSPS